MRGEHGVEQGERTCWQIPHDLGSSGKYGSVVHFCSSSRGSSRETRVGAGDAATQSRTRNIVKSFVAMAIIIMVADSRAAVLEPRIVRDACRDPAECYARGRGAQTSVGAGEVAGSKPGGTF